MEGGDERFDGQDEVDSPMTNSQSVQCPNFLDFVIGHHWVKIMEERSKRLFIMTIKTTPTQLKDRLIL